MPVQVDVLSPRENQWEALNLLGMIQYFIDRLHSLILWIKPEFRLVLEMIRHAGDDHAAFEEQRAFQQQ